MTIDQIRKLPTCYKDAKTGDTHESALRAYQILEKVKEMLERKDSTKTIIEVIELCESSL